MCTNENSARLNNPMKQKKKQQQKPVIHVLCLFIQILMDSDCGLLFFKSFTW